MLIVLDSTLRAALAADTTQADQAAAVVAAFLGEPVTARNFNAAGTLVMETVHGTPVADASTPRGWSLGAIVRGSTVWHVSGETIARSVYRNSSAVDIYSLDAADLTPAPLVVQTGRHHQRGERSTARSSLPVDGMPSWYPSVGVCVEIALATSVTAAVTAAGGASYGGTDPTDIMEPWSGGALIYISGQPYLVVRGGGHNDSAWNGNIKVGPLWGPGSNTPTASVWTPASSTGAVTTTGTYSDGQPGSNHTYNSLVGVGGTLYAVRTDGYYSGPGDSSPDAWSFTASGATAITDFPSSAHLFTAAAHYSGNIYAVAAASQFGKLRVYSISGNSWTSEGNADFAFSNYATMAIDTTRGKILALGGGTGSGLTTGAYWDAASLTRQLDIAGPSGTTWSLEYDPDTDEFVSFADSLTLQRCSAASLAAGSGATWSGRTFTGDTPAHSPSWGTYGRFRHVPEAKGYFVVPESGGSIFFFRSA